MNPGILRWPIVALVAAAVVYLVLTVDVRWRDPRPVGSADDIERLAERDDVNVLFVLIDTLRADRLGSYGYERDTSPTLDAIAASGVRFARHLSHSSWTKCSMASLWTGVYPARNRVTRFNDVLPEQAKLPAEILREEGFRTGGMYRNGWVDPSFGFGQGFEVYERPIPKPPPASVRRENPTVLLGGSDNDLVGSASDFLRIHGHERWFLYLHLMDIHQYAYDEASARFGTAYSDVYDNAILWTDGVVDRVLTHLADEGYLENTLIVISSDHGEAFRERGLEGHARFVYRETTEVPFLLSFPFRLDPGVVIPTRTQNVDVWPTVLDLLGLPPMEGVDGRSMRPEILAAARGETVPESDRPALAHLDRHWGQRHLEPSPTVAVTDGAWRFIYIAAKTPKGEAVAREELFDSDSDPRELTNVVKQHPETASRLRSIVEGYLDSPPPPWGEAATPLKLDEMQLNQLRALGYSLP